jgi:hypothetical protein
VFEKGFDTMWNMMLVPLLGMGRIHQTRTSSLKREYSGISQISRSTSFSHIASRDKTTQYLQKNCKK